MQKTIEVLKALTLGVCILVGASVFVLLLQVSSAVKRADAGVNGVIVHLEGVLDRSGKLIDDARLSADNLNKAAIDERFYFEHQMPVLMEQAHVILGNVQTATADLDPLLQETTARTKALAPIEVSATDLFVAANKMVSDPQIPDAIANLDRSSAELEVTSRESADTMASVRSMAADGQEEVHKLTHPKPLVTIADWTLKVVHAIGGFF